MLELCWAPGLIMLYGSQACRKFATKIVSFSLASYALFFFIFLCFLAFSHLSGLPTNGGFLLGKVVFHLLLGSFCFRVENITQCLKYHQKCRTLISHLNWLQWTKFKDRAKRETVKAQREGFVNKVAKPIHLKNANLFTRYARTLFAVINLDEKSKCDIFYDILNVVLCSKLWSRSFQVANERFVKKARLFN